MAVSNEYARRLGSLLGRIETPEGAYFIASSEGSYAQLRVEMETKDNVTGAPMIANGRWWRLSPHMTDGEIVQTAFKAYLTFLEHEAREQFKVDGVSVFDPHYDLDALIALRKSPGGGLKERT